MAITSTITGNNTVQLSITTLNNDYSSFSDVTTAVANAITGVNPVDVTGWTLYDSFTSGIIYTQVFQSLNKDGTSYKNAIFKWNRYQTEINISTCEYWDKTNHVPQNEAWTFFDSSPISYKLDNCELIILINPRWLVMHSYICGEQGLWAGIFETVQESITPSTTKHPCWGWISSTLWNLGAPSWNAQPLGLNDTVTYPLISMPRTRTGFTGLNAAKYWGANYGVAAHPSFVSPSGSYSFSAYVGNYYQKYTANTWDRTKQLVMPIKPIYNSAGWNNNVTNYGHIYGLKILSPTGVNMNKIQHSIDSDGNTSAAGTSADHWVLNLHHKTYDNAGWFGNTNTTSQIINTNYIAQTCAVVVNQFVYTASYNGSSGYFMCKSNTLTGTPVPFSNGLIGYNIVLDMKYDGERYIYVCSNQLYRIDTRDDSMMALNVGYSLSTCSINQTHIICAQQGSTTAPVIIRVLKSTFALDPTYGTTTLSGWVESIMFTDAVTDFEGNVHMTAQYPSTIANFRLVKISYNPGASPTYSTLSNTISGAASISSGLFVVDENTILCYLQTTTTMYVFEYNPKTLTRINLFTFPAVNTTSPSKIYTVKVGGCLYFAQPTPSNTTCYGSFISLGSNTTSLANSPMSYININGLYSGSGYNTWTVFNGSQLISSYNGNNQSIRVFRNTNGPYNISNVMLAQVAIPS